MPTVNIPPEHFTNNVKNNYADHRTALIREFLQNSVDAGAKEIHFDFDQDRRTLTVSDDGCGMSLEVLVSALLTMSGSHKEANSVGGFGAAKEIILFQHQEYEVHTCQNGISVGVIGSQLQYEFTGCSLDKNGTTITIKFCDHYDLCEFGCVAIRYLQSCEVDTAIFWNKQKVSSIITKGDLLKSTEWSNIYVRELSYECCEVVVRINGVSMFEPWVSPTKFQVIIELIKPSLEILTVNRDGFTWKYSSELNKLLHEVSVEKNQFGKAYGQHKVWTGGRSSYDDIHLISSDILENCDCKFSDHEINRYTRSIAKFMESAEKDKLSDKDQFREDIRCRAEELDIPNILVEKMIEHADQLMCNHKADFYIQVSGKGFDKIPDHLKPGKWGKRYASLAKLWKHCIRLIMRANGYDYPYTIGWVIDDDESVEAMWKLVGDVNVFYMNPMLTWMRSSNHMHVFYKNLMNAAHEVTHVFYQYHDERFINKYENILHRAICMINRGGNSWWKEYLASKNEVI